MTNRHLMINAEAKFREWLDAQPVGTEWTARDASEILCKMGKRCAVSANSIRFLMMRFDNVEGYRDDSKKKRGVYVYRKVRE